MEQRFGLTQVCSVGTYGTLKLKSAITDFSRLEGIPIPTVRRICKIIEREEIEESVEALFKLACKRPELKNFINDHAEMFNHLFLAVGQPKTSSVHACAMMIFPKEKSMYEWTPVKRQKDLITTEWEGGELDEAGFLKEDILGIEQLDKFTDTLDLIERHTGKRIDLYIDISLDDPDVFQAFRDGFCQNLFHFGAKGLSSYVVQVAPRSIDDLMTCICLYRPGPMENGFHQSFLKRRSGEEEVDYPIGAESILKNSFGLPVAQEHIMLMCQVLAGFSLQKADDVRKAMGKKKIEKLKNIKTEFIEGYVKRFGDKGVTEEYAENLWAQMEEFGKYGFNLSHAAAYSINGYNSMWFKVHYPLEFWSVSFSRASQDDYPYYINEIKRSGNIEIKPVDINYSEDVIVSDVESNSIYWALNSVTQLGEAAQKELMEERRRNGGYFSFEEFVDRFNNKGSSVNKSVVENLIYSGAFDSLENIKHPTDRVWLLRKYRELKKVKVDPSKDEYSVAESKGKSGKSWWWLLQQKKKSGFGFFDYEALVKEYLEPYIDTKGLLEPVFVDSKDYQDEDLRKYDQNHVMVGGYLLDIVEKNSKRGLWGELTIESNYEFLRIICFPGQWEMMKDLILKSKKDIVLINGLITNNTYTNLNSLMTVDCSQLVVLGVD